MSQPYLRTLASLSSGVATEWNALAEEVANFPYGVDDLTHNPWIVHAVGTGSQQSIQWMLDKGVDLDFCGDDGYTLVHCALERQHSDQYDVLELLLAAGAPINRKGINDWTPAHMAAARDDVEALEILVRHGADLAIRTDIDDYATPLEEARILGKLNAARYLESVT